MLEQNAQLRGESVMAVTTRPRILVDFNWLGHAKRFRVPLRPSIREQLRVGDEVLLYGDDVEDMLARVLAVSGGELDVEFQIITD